MVISKLVINGFKSINRLSLPLDPNITLLIGPNESGKTNVLKAVEAINPEVTLDLNLTCQFSDLYKSGKPPIVDLEFSQLNKGDKEKLTNIHSSFSSIDSFILRKEGNNQKNYKIIIKDKTFSVGSVKPLFALIPKILYFDSLTLIKDRINFDELTKKDNKYHVERNLLKISGINDPSIVFDDSTHGRRAIEEASRVATERIQQVWSQEPSLEIKLRVNGKTLYIDFSDETTVYDTPKSRSNGFLWYLSFYINFLAATNDANINEYVFLFDEPGVHLHPSGQKDLTQLLENLSKKNQIIYTTHSPFMINRNYPHRVKVITKDEKGTKVFSEAYKDNWKPLRQSIGLTIGDLFFFSNKGIIFDIPNKKKKTPA